MLAEAKEPSGGGLKKDLRNASAAAGGSSAAEPKSPGSAYSANYDGSPGADRI